MKGYFGKTMRQTRIKLIISIVSISIVLVMSSCTAKSIVLTMPDSSKVSIETRGLSKDQIELLEEVQQGDKNVVELLRSGLFTLEQLYSLGLDLPGKFPNINFGDGISDGYPDKDAPGAGN
ncbi:MAG: hypothetical protein JXN10_09480 [Clostridia bacterium]|nr:hypothetical protein [Clostridia bacterium]